MTIKQIKKLKVLLALLLVFSFTPPALAMNSSASLMASPSQPIRSYRLSLKCQNYLKNKVRTALKGNSAY